MLRQIENSDAPDPLVAAWGAEKTTKKCPDCAETILADANVCKHCGYRFAAKNVRCDKCQHVQVVPLSQPIFACEQCGTKLRRRTQPS
jgi:ribosomal protein L37AE/L43A